jgi:Uma2 family endonuclease
MNPTSSTPTRAPERSLKTGERSDVATKPAIKNGPLPLLAPEDIPHVEDLVTEDDTPVDNFPSDKQQRLLIEPLYSTWTGPGKGRSFLAAANVGLFFAVQHPPVVPDVLLSLDVVVAENWWAKSNRSYFAWVFGKMPDVVFEIVSNLEGGEADTKLLDYARIGIPYYVLYDPLELLGGGVLRLFALRGRTYESMTAHWIPEVGLGLTLWQGTYEGKETQWLRWCDQGGQILPTGAERAERLAAQLRALGIEPIA